MGKKNSSTPEGKKRLMGKKNSSTPEGKKRWRKIKHTMRKLMPR